ncbi:MAG: nicotinamide riboside transporter PnuC [Marinicella sp.]|nr:nicotinamide mononucleotide transporter [Xanthomonadales bacterium]
MADIWPQIVTAWQAQSILEVVAVFTGIIYLLLAIKENIWCWFFAIISTGVSVYLFFDVELLSESLLYLYYFIMAFYGFYQWKFGDNHHERRIISWHIKKHLMWIAVTGAMVPVLGYTTSQWGAAMPYLDAFTTCFAIFSTVLVAYKVLENWHYWLIVNTISVYLYASKELYLYAAMSALYVVLTVTGMIKWRQSYANQLAK